MASQNDGDDSNVLHYTVHTHPAWHDEEVGQFHGPFVNNATATRLTVAPNVTEIGEFAFYECTRLSSLQGMGEGVTKISNHSFGNCAGLTTLQGMGENVESIGRNAFQYCSALTSLRGIPESVTVISSEAFYHCDSLTSLAGLPSNLTKIGGGRSDGGGGDGGEDGGGDGGSENGEHGNSMFATCTSLSSLQGLSKNVKELGPGCFRRCYGMTSLLGGENVTRIGNSAFMAADSLVTLEGLSRNVEAVGDPRTDVNAPYTGAFDSCTSLVSIGPGFSPKCFVHPNTFNDCPALLAASEALGFSSAIEWGRYRWLSHARRRYAVLTSVRQVRRAYNPNPPTAGSLLPSPLLSLLACSPDDIVRVIAGYMGEGEEESGGEREERWRRTAVERGGEAGRQRERAERLEEEVVRQRGEVVRQREEAVRQREETEERVEQMEGVMEQQREQIEELLRREREGRFADEVADSGDRRVRQKRSE